MRKLANMVEWVRSYGGKTAILRARTGFSGTFFGNINRTTVIYDLNERY